MNFIIIITGWQQKRRNNKIVTILENVHAHDDYIT